MRGDGAAAAGGLGVMRLGAFLLRHRLVIAGWALGLAFLAGLHTWTKDRMYIATASFTAAGGQGPRGAGALAGLASQLGFQIDLARNDPTAFYAALARSRELLDRVVSDTYEVRDAEGIVRSGDLKVFLRVRGNDERERQRRAVERLRRMVTVIQSPQTGIIEFKVEARTRELAEQIAENILREINEFSLRRRQGQAGGERAFIESRVVEAESRLAAAEAALATFLRGNREYLNSPNLVRQHDELERRVMLRQQVLISLIQNAEQAKIEELRNTPVVLTVDSPTGWGRPKPRGLVIRTALGLFFGALFGVGIAMFGELLRAERAQDPEGFATLRSLGSDAVRSVRGLVVRERGRAARGQAP